MEFRPIGATIKIVFLSASSSSSPWTLCLEITNENKNQNFYRPQRSWGKVMFLQASVILFTGGGVRGFIREGGRAWFYSGGRAWFYSGGVRGFIRGGGACMVLFRGGMLGFIWGGGRAWFYSGGRVWFYSGGVHGFIRGGRAWFYSGGAGVRGFMRGGVRGFIQGGGVRGFSSFCGYNEIRSMSGRYASYWNAFLFYIMYNNSCVVEQRLSFEKQQYLAISDKIGLLNKLFDFLKQFPKMYKQK